MKLQSFLNTRVLAAAIVLLPFAARADQWNKKTVLTINEKVQVRDRVLEPGTYVFKLLDSNADRHIVQIFNSDQSHIIDTVLAIPEYRTEPTGRSQFKFYETPSGYAKALRAWYYPGDNFGQGFTYPKHLEMLAMAIAPPAAPMAMETQTQEETAAPQPEPPPPAPAPAEVAQNEPPPAPASPAPEPAVTQAPALPTTASPYPLIGLAGLIFIGAFGMLRLKRSW